MTEALIDDSQEPSKGDDKVSHITTKSQAKRQLDQKLKRIKDKYKDVVVHQPDIS